LASPAFVGACPHWPSVVLPPLMLGGTVLQNQIMKREEGPMLIRVLAFATVAMLGAQTASAQEVVRIGLPTKTYYPTIIAETALRQKLFEKEGIKAELTIYRSGGETFEAMAAGAADLQLNSAALVAAGRRKGVDTKAVAGAALGY